MVQIPMTFDPNYPPERAHKTDAGLDLKATENHYLKPNQNAADNADDDHDGMIGTGLHVNIPEGYAGLLFGRSSISKRHLSPANAVGLIDAGYIGEVKVNLHNAGARRVEPVHAGDKIAQLVIVELPPVEFVQVDCLEETERGEGGFGSTGK